MNEAEKEKRIAEIQQMKNDLSPEIKEAFQAKESAFTTYNDLNFKWLNLKTLFEDLDREEKLLFFSMLKNQTKPTKRLPKNRTKESQEAAKRNVLKALKSMPSEIREQILKQFK